MKMFWKEKSLDKDWNKARNALWNWLCQNDRSFHESANVALYRVQNKDKNLFEHFDFFLSLIESWFLNVWLFVWKLI